MVKSKKFNYYGLTALLITIIITKALLSAPGLYVKHSESAGWIEVLLSGLFEIFTLAVFLKLYNRFDGLSLIDIAENAFGAGGKVIVGGVSVVVFMVSTAAIFRSMAETVRNTVMRGSSYETVMAFLLIAGVTAACMGLRTQINLAGLVLPVILFAVGIILVINISRISLTNIQPFLGTGATDIIKNALLNNASFYEIGAVFFLCRYCGKNKHVKKISFTALSVSVGVISLITLLYQLAVPYEAASTFALPLYQMTRMLRAGTFFQRIEPLNLLFWGMATFVYVGFGIFMCADIMRRTFDLTDYKPLTYVMGIIIALISLIPGSETSVERIFDFIISYSYVVYPILPLLLLILANIITKKKTGA